MPAQSKPKPPIHIRPAKKGEGEQLLNHVYANAEQMQGVFSPRHVAVWEQQYLSPVHPCSVLVATAGNDKRAKAVAYMSYTTPTNSTKYAQIPSLYTRRKWQRQGIGAQLLRRALAHIDAHRVATRVESTPAGETLYYNHGFRNVPGQTYLVRQPPVKRTVDRCAIHPMF